MRCKSIYTIYIKFERSVYRFMWWSDIFLSLRGTTALYSFLLDPSDLYLVAYRSWSRINSDLHHIFIYRITITGFLELAVEQSVIRLGWKLRRYEALPNWLAETRGFEQLSHFSLGIRQQNRIIPKRKSGFSGSTTSQIFTPGNLPWMTLLAEQFPRCSLFLSFRVFSIVGFDVWRAVEFRDNVYNINTLIL